MRREQPRIGGEGEGEGGGCFWFRTGRKCGDRKFSSGRIIDRAKDIQSEHVWS